MQFESVTKSEGRKKSELKRGDPEINVKKAGERREGGENTLDRARSRAKVTFSSSYDPAVQRWLGQDRQRERAWILVSYMPAWLGPGAINYNLIEGYHGDPAVTRRRTEVVIEEGVPVSPFPARELCRLEQYWSWQGAAVSVA